MTAPPFVMSSIAETETMCDDLLIMLLARKDYPRKKNITVDELRPVFWKLVFSDGWDTSQPNPKPTAFEPMRESMNDYKGIHIGQYFDEGNGRRGSWEQAWLKVQLKEDDLSFCWYGLKGERTLTIEVLWLRGTGDVKAKAVNDWDARELTKVSDWNADMIRFWGRQRLLKFVRELNGNTSDDGQTEYVFDEVEEDVQNLEKPRLCRQILREKIKRERLEIGRIAKSQTQNLSVADLYDSHQGDQINNKLKEDDVHLKELREAKEMLLQLLTEAQVDYERHYW
ncbi:hypothetical protein CkaCkLH20_12981 [Colletotrichum karsti]|uniref:Uncharacterized protein n=1 Tax=Colletotrichum karsti TaxID=1095194 RepID=A0A9P6HS35_9PEZI|nr:uncharacterized protein CkaCkLH20_12981 [Colletotrichum karsti]KAF9869588.1 hypothetical protein CkaCkLH20_12981 [Colletotrichum karsti]